MSNTNSKNALRLRPQLRLFLDARNMTPAQLSRKSGVNKSVISDWLAGVTPRGIQHVKRVATVLGTSIDHLCFGDGVEEENASAEKDPLDELVGDGWFGGLFEIRMRRITRK